MEKMWRSKSTHGMMGGREYEGTWFFYAPLIPTNKIGVSVYVKAFMTEIGNL